MILTSPPRSKDQTDNKEKDNTTQNNIKQLDICPNAAMIQNQNPNPWIPFGSYILDSFQCMPTSHDFSTMIRIIQDHASFSSKVAIHPHHQTHPPHVAAPRQPVCLRTDSGCGENALRTWNQTDLALRSSRLPWHAATRMIRVQFQGE